MELNEYQKKAISTAVYPKKYKIIYPAIGVGDEAGEVLGKVKKWMRGDDGKGKKMNAERKEKITDEMGDVLWYLAALANDLGVSFDDIAKANINKLQLRKKKDKIKGSGDKR